MKYVFLELSHISSILHSQGCLSVMYLIKPDLRILANKKVNAGVMKGNLKSSKNVSFIKVKLY